MVKNHTFTINYFPEFTSFWNRDIDLLKPQSVVDTVVNHTPLSNLEVHSMFLNSYESILFENSNPKSYTKGILSLGIQHRYRKNNGLLYCAGCLGKDNPYYRKEWRVMYNIACCKCKILLKDKCNVCHSPITFHRLGDLSNRSSALNTIKFNYCTCGSDLSDNINHVQATKEELEYQEFTDETIKNGYNQYTGYSFLFFDVIYTLCYKYAASQKRLRYKQALNGTNDINFEILLKRNVSLWPIEERKELLLATFRLLKDYPYRLQNFLRKHKIPKTSIKSSGILPFWFQKYAFDSL